MRKIYMILMVILWLMLTGAGVMPTAEFEDGVDYMALMIDAAADADSASGQAAELARNAKIEALELDVPTVSYDELVLLAQLIHTEAGSDWLSTDWKMAVGEVALNRVASPEFPNTLEEVVFQTGQYVLATEVYFAILVPYRDCVEAAARVLTGARVLDDPSVVFHGGARQGSGVALKLVDDVYGPAFFCYSWRPELYE